MAVGVAQKFKDLFFSTGKVATGSVTEYYADVSGHKIALDGEVVGPYRMPLTLAQYANGAKGLGGAFPNIRTLANDALAQARSHVNFGPYDNDGNGYVDAFVVVHAGRGAEQTGNVNDIWSAKWSLPNEVAVNNVKVYAFLTVPEDALLGVCAHELGHLLFGWPDLYDTDYSSEGVGKWCLMSAGSWGGSPAGSRPVHPSAWCKANQQWVSVINETASRTLALGDVKATRETHKIWKLGDTASQEYFLIENRELNGFDQFLPGPGLLGTHTLKPSFNTSI
jgi:immune inhibitor A